MRIFLAGGTGAIGRQLVPLLIERGHEVIAMTRSESRFDQLLATGAEPVLADALDAAAVHAAVSRSDAEVVVHQLTAIPPAIDPRRFEEAFAQTNRLRREGTRHLADAALAAGARKLVAQSIAQAYAPTGGWIKVEDDPLYSNAPPAFRDTFDAVIELERTALSASDLEPVVLRYANFYGPGTAYADGGFNAELVRAERFPIAGGGSGHWSFIHIDDAARATLAAIEDGATGVYNVADDEPAPVSEWLPGYADALDAPPPPRTPEPRSDYGRFGMLEARGASNAKAKRSLGWALEHPSWRQGFPAAIGAEFGQA